MSFVSQWSTHKQLILGVFVRLILLGVLPTPFLQALADRPELSTPLTSFRRLKEGLFLNALALDPYDGGVFNHSPVHLLFFSTFSFSSTLTSLSFVAADIIAAAVLATIWKNRITSGRKSDRDGQNWEAVVSFLYLCNPYTIFTCLAKSTTAIDNCLVILSLYQATSHHPAQALFFLALATMTSIYPILLLPFIIQILLQSPPSASPEPKQGDVYRIGRLLGVYVLMGLGMGVGMRGMMGRWEAVWKGLLVILGVKDLTPNVGLSWYFFTEMFDHFRSFFIMVFQAHLAIYVLPLSLAFQSDPLLGVLCQTFLISTLKTYPTVGDSALSASLLPLFPHIFPRLTNAVVILGLHTYSLILFPLLHHLWLHAGSANANFFYAAGLVYGLGNVLGASGVVWAARGAVFEREKGIEGAVGEGRRWVVVQVTD